MRTILRIAAVCAMVISAASAIGNGVSWFNSTTGAAQAKIRAAKTNPYEVVGTQLVSSAAFDVAAKEAASLDSRADIDAVASAVWLIAALLSGILIMLTERRPVFVPPQS